MIATDYLCRAEGAVPPLARANFRRNSAVPGRSHRKLRSRSSPVRTGTASPDGRARSPSASPPRLQLGDRYIHANRPPDPSSHAQLTTLASLKHRHHLVKQRAGLLCNSAFYSLRPPALPMRLVTAGASAPPAITPVGPPSRSVPPPPPLRSMAHDCFVSSQSHTPQKIKHVSGSRCQRLVRRLLTDLLAALPLAAPSNSLPFPVHPEINEQTYATDTRSEEPILPPVRCSRTILAVVEPPEAPHATDCRSVAVQALGSKRSIGDSDFFRYFDESQREGWVGGVRALRDSHVRLVLRQLRHIERLNRALDRTVRLPPAPATAESNDTKLYQRTPRPL